MPRGRPKGSKNKTSENPERKTPVKLDPIPRLKEGGKVHEAWAIMEGYVQGKSCFEHLRAANIRLYWTKDWKPDVDNVVTGAQVSKASERERLDAELRKEPVPDAQIILPKTQWPMLSDTAKKHRVFHELCHIAFSKNANGDVRRTTHDWSVVRIRRHPIVAFYEEIDEFGIATVIGRNSETLKAVENVKRPLLASAEKAEASKEAEGNGEQPAGTEDSPPAPVTNPDAWKRMSVKALELNSIVETKLLDAGVKTLGQLSNHIVSRGDSWGGRNSGILGIGEAAAQQINAAYTTFWAAHPDFRRPAAEEEKKEPEESLI